jgi:DNA-binding HxlR family transcriptional regulator
LQPSSLYLLNASLPFTTTSGSATIPRVKRYDQYCPMAHALDLVGERWALLIVRELIHGPKRYTDLAEHLPGIGTNILAARLKSLEEFGVITKRTLPPPAASKVYELTEYGLGLKTVLRELALWGARSLGPPSPDEDLYPGWLTNALELWASRAPHGSLEFRVGEEIASIVDGEVRSGSVEEPDALVTGEPSDFFHLLIDGRLDDVAIEGDRDLLERLVRDESLVALER